MRDVEVISRRSNSRVSLSVIEIISSVSLIFIAGRVCAGVSLHAD